MYIKRPIRKLAMTAICCLFLFFFMIPRADAQMSTTIRVFLKRLSVQDTLTIEVNGTYMLEGGAMLFRDGTDMTIALRNGKLVLHTKDMAIDMGAAMKLQRCDERSSLKLAGQSSLYEGDLALDISGEVIRPILHIDVEDYLLGVVPYEMGDSFPLEALKAQAIAARTYAIRKSGSSGAYDVEDTTNDQAYKGRSSASPLSEQAVTETKGLCGVYQGQLAECFYSASNGGQTELGQHVWPSENPQQYGYMDMRDDPYDLENEASSVKRYTLEKKPGEDGVGAALHSEIVAALKPQLEGMGYTAQDDLIRIDEIVRLELNTPKFEEPSRLMTQMEMELKISARNCLYRDPGGQPVQDVTPEPLSSPSPTPRPTATPAYSPYSKVERTFTITLPIFTTAEKAMGLSINVYQNELMTVMDIGSAYVVESRRYGHGVGMSQRGAQQMAEAYGKTYHEILAFYYPGMQLGLLEAIRTPLPTIDADLMATPAPTPSPTPRPTLMPVTEKELPEGAYIAVVSNIDDDSSLNLREAPTLSSDIKRRLFKNQRLIVLSVSKDGWAHVKTDVIEGYVKYEYLQAAEKE